jgi:hypothetical protein
MQIGTLNPLGFKQGNQKSVSFHNFPSHDLIMLPL